MHDVNQKHQLIFQVNSANNIIRDPLVILKEYLHPTDETSSYHFDVC
jgi:hypothetical protein